MADFLSRFPDLEKTSYCQERKERLGGLSCEECEGIEGCEIRTLILFRNVLDGLVSGRKTLETETERANMIETIQDVVPILEKWVWGGKFRKVE